MRSTTSTAASPRPDGPAPFSGEWTDDEDDEDALELGEDDNTHQRLQDQLKAESASLLADKLGHAAFRDFLEADKADKALGAEGDSLLDLLQRRLFLGPGPPLAAHEGREPRARDHPPPSAASKTSASVHKSTLAAFLAQRAPCSLDEASQRALARRPPRSPSISPEKLQRLTSRFRAFEDQKTRRLAARRREVETQQQAQTRAAPPMNAHSRRLTSQIPAFPARQASLLAKKRQHEAQQQQQHEQERAHDRALDLQASVRTPCICSHGNASRSAACLVARERATTRSPTTSEAADGSDATAARDEPRHSQACERFMAMCSKMNASSAIQRKKQLMTRSVDALLAFHEEKRQRQQARAAQAHAREAQETTFAPRINPKSEKIYVALVASGRLDASRSPRVLRPRHRPSLPPTLPFQPRISNKSKWLVRNKQRALLAQAGDATTATWPASPPPRDVFSRLQQAPSRRSRASLERPDGQEATATTVPVACHVVQYDAQCAFILESFRPPLALP